MKYVKITKIAHRPDAKFPPAKTGDWEPGTENPVNTSLPVGYTVEGWMAGPPNEGQPIEMERHVRNGVKALGYFTTSPVKETGKGRLDGFDGEFYTENSVYRIEPATPASHRPEPRLGDRESTCAPTY